MRSAFFSSYLIKTFAKVDTLRPVKKKVPEPDLLKNFLCEGFFLYRAFGF